MHRGQLFSVCETMRLQAGKHLYLLATERP